MIEPHELSRWLEDRKVVSVRRSGDEVLLELAAVRRDEAVRRVTVRLTGVSNERASYYVGEKVTAAHPDPSMPLDLIAFVAYQGSTLTLGGYRAGEPWYEWELSVADIGVEQDGGLPGA